LLARTRCVVHFLFRSPYELKSVPPLAEEAMAAERGNGRAGPVTTPRRPSHDEYHMNIAFAVQERANCRASQVGAILVFENQIISTGYNGTPEGTVNCDEGGCDRCLHRDKYGRGQAYDRCICVHAEQNALLAAARHGIAVRESTLYTTMQPCFGCTKELLQAQILRVFYETLGSRRRTW
jgi:deoxycytidylate deaminase